MLDNKSDASEIDLLQAGYRFAYSLTHQHHDAEDCVQEAWLRLCRTYGAVESRSLLFTTVRNIFTDRCRRDKIVSFETLEADEADPRWDTTEFSAEAEPGVTGDLDHLLGHLRAEEREVLFLHHLEGRTAREISELTGRPRGTVLSLMQRALKKLREEAEKNPRAPFNRFLLWFVSFF